MPKKIFVGSLSYKVDEDTLREVFERIGEVHSVKIMLWPLRNDPLILNIA